MLTIEDTEKNIWPRLDQYKEVWLNEPERKNVAEIRTKLSEEVRELLGKEGFEYFRNQCYQIEARWPRA